MDVQSLTKGSTEIGIFFNDLTNCTLYFTHIRIDFDIGDLRNIKLSFLGWRTMDIKTAGNNYPPY
jgi:hypothetical protein